MKTIKVYVDAITVGPRLREADRERVAVLADSMARIGLQQPISVWTEPDEHNLGAVHLVAGLHRLRAAEMLGWEQIDAIEVDLNDIDRRRWEIAENLHRAELTVLQRDEHIEEWRKLTLEAEKVRQVAAPGGSQPKEKGYRKTAKEFGTSEKDVRRAEKVASLSDEAKEAAREVHLDDNRSALLEAAKAPPEKQAEVLREIAEKKKAKPEPSSVQWTAEDEATYGDLLDAWEKATPAARNQFIKECSRKVA